jgi:WD40 repeat protein
MRIGEIGDEEVLVTTDDSGHVVVHFPKDNFSRSPLLLKVPMSAWGIDTHSTKRLLAISCNALIVTVFHLGMGIEGWEWTTTSPEDGEIPSIVMRQHTNNIPCVAFDQTGEYVVSGSLDCTIRMWDCKTGQLLGVVAAMEQYCSCIYD